MKLKIVLLISIYIVSTQVFAMVDSKKPTEEMQKILTEMETKKGKPVETLNAPEARMQPTPTDAVRSVMAKSPDANTDILEVSEVKEIMVDGASGFIPARIYKPYTKEKGPLPVVVYYHGGGFVLADNNTYDSTPRALASKTKALFVAVEYRKAPEHKFPAAHDDAFAAYKWVVNNAASIGGDPKRVAVAGESAGGNLALNVAVRARNEKFKLPVHQLLIYPVAGNNMETESYKEFGNAKPLNKSMMNWFMDNYLNTPAEREDPRINLLSADLRGLSPTTIITAQIDPLQSEGKELSKKLKKQGVKVSYRNYDGVTHEFFGMAPVLREARSAQEMAASRLKKSFKL